MGAMVAPFTGAWIEILAGTNRPLVTIVAPFTGAWIEIIKVWKCCCDKTVSHPSRVRGLKFGNIAAGMVRIGRRTLHGCVD